MTIKAIVFDNGNILLASTFERFRSQQARLMDIPLKKYIKALKPPLLSLLTGKSSQKKFYSEVLKGLKKYKTKKHLIPKLIKLRFATIKQIPKIQNIMKQLSKQYPLHMINNEDRDSMRYFLKKYSYFKYFKSITTSYKAKVKKPSPKIFKIALKKIKLKPKELLFIDDHRPNVVTARKLGFKTILVRNKNSTKLKKDLRKLGIVVK